MYLLLEASETGAKDSIGIEHNAQVQPDDLVQSTGATVAAAAGPLLTGVLGFGLGAEGSFPLAVEGRIEAPTPPALSVRFTDAERSTDTDGTGFSVIVGMGDGAAELRLFDFNSFSDALTLESTVGGTGKLRELGAGRGGGVSVSLCTELGFEFCPVDSATAAPGPLAMTSTSTLFDKLSALSAAADSSPSAGSSRGFLRTDLSRFAFG